MAMRRLVAFFRMCSSEFTVKFNWIGIVDDYSCLRVPDVMIVYTYKGSGQRRFPSERSQSAVVLAFYLPSRLVVESEPQSRSQLPAPPT